MSRYVFSIDLDAEEWAALWLLQDESGQKPPTDALITSIIRSVIHDDLEEERKRAS